MFDDLLTAVLLIAVPGYNLWRSLARRNRPPEPRIHTYRRGIFLAAVLAALLAADWGMAGRSPALLGLGWPPATPGLIGLALAALLLVTAAVVVRSAKANAKAADAGAAMLPQTPKTIFLVLGFGILFIFSFIVSRKDIPAFFNDLARADLIQCCRR